VSRYFCFGAVLAAIAIAHAACNHDSSRDLNFARTQSIGDQGEHADKTASLGRRRYQILDLIRSTYGQFYLYRSQLDFRAVLYPAGSADDVFVFANGLDSEPVAGYGKAVLMSFARSGSGVKRRFILRLKLLRGKPLPPTEVQNLSDYINNKGYGLSKGSSRDVRQMLLRKRKLIEYSYQPVPAYIHVQLFPQGQFSNESEIYELEWDPVRKRAVSAEQYLRRFGLPIGIEERKYLHKITQP
jgi:hypothetical protein